MAHPSDAAGDLGPVGSLDGAAWRTVLGLDEGEVPAAVITEGSWWRAQRTAWRVGRLEGSRELGVPDVHLGRWRGAQVMYACPYGAPATAEVVHIAALVGARLSVQIGTCGIVGVDVRPGDVIVPTEAACLEGVAASYGAEGLVRSSPQWSQRAVEVLHARGITVHQGRIVTWGTLFAQPRETVRQWRGVGYLGVDMETATTLAVASRFGVPATSLLVAWDDVLSGRSFLDPLAPMDAAAFEAANEAVFEVCLSLAEEVAAA